MAAQIDSIAILKWLSLGPSAIADENAFSILRSQVWQKVWRRVVFMMPERERDAEDLFQEFVLYAGKVIARHGEDQISDPIPFLSGVCRNFLLDQRKQAKKQTCRELLAGDLRQRFAFDGSAQEDDLFDWDPYETPLSFTLARPGDQAILCDAFVCYCQPEGCGAIRDLGLLRWRFRDELSVETISRIRGVSPLVIQHGIDQALSRLDAAQQAILVDCLFPYFAEKPPDLRRSSAMTEHPKGVCLLHDVLGFKGDEAAEALGVPPATARKRLERARRDLRKCILTRRSGSAGGGVR